MNKKLRVTVDGKSYDVTVEVPDEAGDSAAAPPPVSAAFRAFRAASCARARCQNQRGRREMCPAR